MITLHVERLRPRLVPWRVDTTTVSTTARTWLASSLLGAALAVAVLGPGCGHSAQASGSDEPERPRPVEVHQVARRPFQDAVRISANILPKRQVKLVPRSPGVLQSVLVKEGDRVEEGQVLAQIEQRDYLLGLKQAQAELQAARANADVAAVGVGSASQASGRMKTLRATNAISQSELDKVDDGLKLGLAQQTAAQAQAQLASVGLEAARTKVADTVIRAPFAGVVVMRTLDEGEICCMGPPGFVLLIADTSQVKVMGSLGELAVSRVKVGMPATIRVDALPGERFQGTIDVVSPMVDPQTRTATVHITVPNPDGRLEMGMAAEIEIDLGERQVLAVPQDAVLRTGDGQERGQVFVVEGDLARRRDVALGARQGDLVEVTGGLSEGDRVVRSGASALRDGQRVAVTGGRDCGPRGGAE
jgi:membrane fusion protein, multidrug efflux system